MTPDYRAMCAELVDALVEWQLGGGPPEDTADADLIDRARTLLAEAVAEGPTDEALANFTAWFCRNYPGPDTLIHRPEWHAPKVFRAAADALARWGRPTPQPVAESGEVPRIGHILRLAEIIREVDGRHDKGAAALAEAILSHPGICSAGLAALAEADGPAVHDGREPASVALQPSDGEIMGLMPQEMHDDLAAAVRAMAEQEGIDSTPAKGVLRIILNRHVVDLARAVLARWGRPAAPPVPEPGEAQGPTDEDTDDSGYEAICRQLIKDLAAARDALEAWADYLTEDNQRAAKFCRKEYESARDAHTKACDAMAILRRPARWGRPAAAPVAEDVAELVEWLLLIAGSDNSYSHARLTRAATLLQQQAAPAITPVSLAERLPGSEDCLDEGWAWFFNQRIGWRQAVLPVSPGFTHWLPASSLPLPAGESNQGENNV